MRTVYYLIDGINPEPWKSPTLGTRRVGRRVVPTSVKDGTLRAYQEALHEVLAESFPELAVDPITDAVMLEMWFWRQLASYTNDKGRKITRHRCDATNLQKATEDALQGLLFKNDSQVRHVRASIMDQGKDVEPRILVAVRWPMPAYNLDGAGDVLFDDVELNVHGVGRWEVAA